MPLAGPPCVSNIAWSVVSLVGLEVACQAVVGRGVFPVALNARAHGVRHGLDRNRHGSDISVALRASDLGPGVRRVAELHRSRFLEPVDALPGDLVFALPVFGQARNLWLVGRDELVAQHALANRRNAGRVTRCRALVAVGALHAGLLDVGGVREADRLFR